LLGYVRLISFFVFLEIRLVNTVVRSGRIFISAESITVEGKLIPHRQRANDFGGLVEVNGVLYLVLVIVLGPEILGKPCHVTAVAGVLGYVGDPVVDKFL